LTVLAFNEMNIGWQSSGAERNDEKVLDGSVKPFNPFLPRDSHHTVFASTRNGLQSRFYRNLRT